MEVRNGYLKAEVDLKYPFHFQSVRSKNFSDAATKGVDPRVKSGWGQ